MHCEVEAHVRVLVFEHEFSSLGQEVGTLALEEPMLCGLEKAQVLTRPEELLFVGGRPSAAQV